MQSITVSYLKKIYRSVAVEAMEDPVKVIFEGDEKAGINLYQQFLQTSFVEVTTGVLNPKNTIYDDAEKKEAINTLKKINSILNEPIPCNKEIKAHRDNLQFLISKALK